jgi:hypothetical protein
MVLISGTRVSTTMDNRHSSRTGQRGRCFATLSLTTLRTILVEATQPKPSQTLSLVCPSPYVQKASTHKSVLDGSTSGVNRTSNSLGTTGQPAVVYLPAGTYTISSPLQLYVGTVLMGNPLSPTIIKASSDFQGNTLIFGKDPNRKYPRSF